VNHVRGQGLMMTSGGRRVVGLALAAWLVGLIPVAAQDPKVKPPAAAQKGKPAASQPKAVAAPAAPEEEAFSYRAEGRRDPFLTLVRRGTEGRLGGKRPEGVAGLAVAEITLKGVLASKGAYFGMIQGPDLRTYIVHPNDRLLDGTVKAITVDSIVIVQDVNDPLSLTKQREIRKTLRVAEEVK
jgi:Tfp pilus assembly protein PilP